MPVLSKPPSSSPDTACVALQLHCVKINRDPSSWGAALVAPDHCWGVPDKLRLCKAQAAPPSLALTSKHCWLAENCQKGPQISKRLGRETAQVRAHTSHAGALGTIPKKE